MSEQKTKKESEKKTEETTKIAIVRIRGGITLKPGVEDTLKMLHLHKKNHCSIIKLSPSLKGMLQRVNRYITWGEIDKETEELLKKRDKGKKYYALNPPRKGYGRKGIKIPFTKSGALGDRKEKINDLIKRMI